MADEKPTGTAVAERPQRNPTKAQTEKAQLVIGDEGYIMPRTVEEALRMADAVIAGKLAPSSYDNDRSKIMLGIMAAMEAGLPPLYGLRQIAIINNRPTIWGDAGIALAQAKGLLDKQETEWFGPDKFNPGETEIGKWPNDYGCLVTIWRKGQDLPYEGRFTVGDAKRAKLWMNPKKAPWIEHPLRMLFSRARSYALRDGFADALAGLAIREEVEDMNLPDTDVITVDLGQPALEAPPLPEE